MERSAGRRPERIWLPCAHAIGGGRSRLVCEKEKAEPVRTFPGPSGVWRPDSAEGVPEGYKEISQAGTGDVSLHAEGLFRSSRRDASERFSRCCSVGSARRADGRLS